MAQLTLDPTTMRLLAALDTGAWAAAQLEIAADAAADAGNAVLAERLRAIAVAGVRPKRIVQEGRVCWSWARAAWTRSVRHYLGRHLYAAVAAEADVQGSEEALFRRRSDAVLALARAWRPPTDAEVVNLYPLGDEPYRVLRVDGSIVGAEPDQVALGPGDTLFEDNGEFVPVAWPSRCEELEPAATIRRLLRSRRSA